MRTKIHSNKKDKSNQEWNHTVLILCRRILNNKYLSLNSNLTSIYKDKKRITALIDKIQNLFNISIDTEVYLKNSTIDNLVKLIELSYIGGFVGSKEEFKVIPRAKIQDHYPLSYTQKRMFVLNKLEPESPFYNINHAKNIEGVLSYQYLEKALNIIINRHESFRTYFKDVNGEPRQYIKSKINYSVNIIELKAVSSKQRKAEKEAEIKKQAQAVFNLNRCPLFNFSLIRENETNHILVIAIHHIISDGLSMEIFYRELSGVYNALCNKEKIILPKLPIQYKDYAVWEQSKKFERRIKKQEKYWLDKLRGELPTLNMPADLPRALIRKYHGNVSKIVLNKDLTSKLKLFAQHTNTTIFSVLLTVLNIFLYRISDQDDIIVGTVSANRQLDEVNNIIGAFLNNLAIRTDMSGDLTFIGLLKGVGRSVIEAVDNEEIPFEHLIEKLNPERDLSRSPIFNVMFQYDDKSKNFINFNQLKLRTLVNHNETTKFDFKIRAIEYPGSRIALFCEYSTDLFCSKTIESYLRIIKTIIVDVLAESNKKISEIVLLSPKEKCRQIRLINNVEVADNGQRTPCQVFEVNAEKYFGKIALQFENISLSYQNLNRRANQLAHYLRRNKVRKNDVVAISLDRSINLAIATLAVHKTGAACYMVDYRSPLLKIRNMLKDSGAKIMLVSRAGNRDNWIKTININNNKINKERVGNLRIKKLFDSLAYVIFTSGSTGQPKAAMLSHRSVLNQAYNRINVFKISKNDICCLNWPMGFVPMTFQFYAPLIAGGKLIIYSESIINNPIKLFESINNDRIRAVDVPTQVIESYLNLIEGNRNIKQRLRSLRILMPGGAKLKEDTVQKFYSEYSKIRILNNYGATETCGPSLNTFLSKGGPIYEGVPVRNTKVYILDKRKNLQPIGIPGELYVSGEGLADGYLNSPKKTNDVFLLNPYINKGRVYKTGDLAKLHQCGQIEILGRMDRQVKIRGFRIELGEIEAAFRKINKIKEAVVIARIEKKGGGKSLAAYYTATGQSLNKYYLKECIIHYLPDYMIPKYFICLDKIPLNKNNKIDIRALPVPEDKDMITKKYAPPKTKTEEQIIKIWQEILNVERISRNDNFFNLGGHSLKAISLLALIRGKIKIEIPLRVIFKYPTVRELSKFIASSKKTIPTIIFPATKSKHYPLSYAQKRMWVLYLLEPMSPFYNAINTKIFTGSINISIFNKAIQFLVSRHEIFRTNFKEINGSPVQFIHPRRSFKLDIISIVKIKNAKKRKIEEQDIIKKQSNTPFRLETDCLIRAGIITTKFNSHIFLITIHQIITDRLSMEIFYQELSIVYNAFIRKKQPRLHNMYLQYKDYAVWEQSDINKKILKLQEKYWLTVLAGDLPILDLPTDFSRPLIQTYRGDIEQIYLEEKIVKMLQILARTQGITLFTLMFTFFNILLHRLTGQEDIIVGVPSAGRVYRETQTMLGVFLNSLSLRTDLSGDPTLVDLIHQVQKNVIEATENEQYPFEGLIEKLDPDRDMGRSPIFSVMFQHDPKVADTIKFDKLKFSHKYSHNETSKFDILLRTTEIDKDRMVVRMEYCTDLFTRATIKKLLKYYIVLIQSCCNAPEKRISDFDILTRSEKYKLIKTFNGNKNKYPKNKTLSQLFEAQAKKTPKKVAVQFKMQKLTYLEINRNANHLAHFLINRGVGRGDVVAIATGRNLELIKATLAAHKAGATCLYVDINYPINRISYIFKKSHAKLLLVSNKQKKHLGIPDRRIINTNDQDITKQPSSNPLVAKKATDSAYILFTSGSTGEPKGVGLSHRGVVNQVMGRIEYLSVTSKDIIPLSVSINYAAITFVPYTPFLSGGKLIIYPGDIINNPQFLFDRFKEDKITICDIPLLFLKSYIKNNQETGKRMRLPESLRILAVSGEKITEDIIDKFNKINRRSLLINNYGQSECSGNTLNYRINPKANFNCLEGRPIQNMQMYILDQKQNLLPPLIPGELYTSGDGLANGYLDDPEKTRAVFLPNPFKKGEMIYKTGDRAKIYENGNIEILGRVDNQIKIRSHRIVPGEIEANIRSLYGVKDVVVVKFKESLVCYFTANNNKSADSKKIKAHLKKHLPDYMIPVYYVELLRFPLTSTGKLDKNSFPTPEQKHLLSSIYSPPIGTLEKKLVRIWKGILKIGKISRDDNFFNLGGHSLKAIHLLSRINRELNIDLPLKEIFLSPTLNKMANSIIQKKQGLLYKTPGSQVVPHKIKPSPKRKYYPLTYAQRRLFFLCGLDSNSPLYHINRVEEITGNLNIIILKRSFRTLIGRHQILRANFNKINDQLVQIIGGKQSINLNIIDLTDIHDLTRRSVEIKKNIREQTDRPFELEIDPLIRFTLIKLRENKNRPQNNKNILALTFHHIISDGWSIDIFYRELAEIYKAQLKNTQPNLPNLPIQYTDYAVWEQSQENEKRLIKQERYWLDKLRGELPILNLPVDMSRPPIQSNNGAVESIMINKDITKKIKKFCQKHDITLFTFLFATFNVFLYKLTGQKDIIIGTLRANRYAETEDIIGLLHNNLPIRTHLTETGEFRELLDDTRRAMLGAVDNSEYSFDRLIEKLKPERDMSRYPVFNVLFQAIELDGTSGMEEYLPSLNIKRLLQKQTVSSFDFDCLAVNRGGFVSIKFCYSTDLFLPDTIRRWLGYYKMVIGGAMRNPEYKISELPFIPLKEKRQLLNQFNDIKIKYPKKSKIFRRNNTIHGIFEEQAKKHPNTIAIEHDKLRVNYLELNEKANQLAHHLKENYNIKPGISVGLIMDRSVGAIVGILAILKAGGAYLPIDPEYPEKRIRYMVNDSHCRVLMSGNNIMSKLEVKKLRNCEIINIDNYRLFSKYPVTNSGDINKTNDLVYVIYTSGSTGEPKGVMITHKALLNTLNWLQGKFKLSDKDVVAHKTSLSFTDSVWEIFWPLITGTKLSIIDNNTVKDPIRLIDKFNQSKITYSQFVPVIMTVFLEAAKFAKKKVELPHLKWIFNGGEHLSPVLANSWYRQFPEARICNIYGMTESAIYATYYVVGPNEDESKISVPIGRAIANTRVYILDKNQKFCPINISGEIYIGGIGVAEGYLYKPKLTKESFIYHSELKQRLYKTGDSGKITKGGIIEYLGRTDHQVQIRGHRIELEEIKNCLTSHPAVKNSVVTVQEGHGRGKQLIAYLELATELSYPIKQYLNLKNKENIDTYEQYTLPNGMAIFHSNKNETDYNYKEIFLENTYLRYFDKIQKSSPCIFDIGANIGLFSLLISMLYPSANIYSFEPAPDIFNILRLNINLYKPDVKIFNFGVSRYSGKSHFTYYPYNSVLSNFYGRLDDEKQIAAAYIRTLEEGKNISRKQIDGLLSLRLNSRIINCQTKNLSEIICENKIKKIDLLKIDAEKSELDILAGIKSADWSKIRYVVFEAHDIGKRLAKTKAILKKYNFNVRVKKNHDLADTGLYTIYAARKGLLKTDNKITINFPLQYQFSDPDSLKVSIREHIKKRLPEYMLPSAMVFLGQLPLSPNGKIDRKALPSPNEKDLLRARFLPPKTYTEKKLADICREILELDKISIYDNFFDLGGNSLDMIKMHSWIEKVYPKQISVAAMFSYPTIYELSNFLSKSKNENIKRKSNIKNKVKDLVDQTENGKISPQAAAKLIDEI